MALPWVRLARLAPVALALARALLDVPPPASKAATKDLHARLATLEDVQRRQAEAVHALAEQTAALGEAAEVLRRRLRTLLVVAIVGGVLALAALLAALLR
ncbi:MAG TPA: hypothetical protein VFV75_12640 [Candidatus Polarisedimenticolaceae bacterium]|nr:hypothetical protein [Candidatus Polarisedimenticolaceae bacterium]